MDPHRFDTLSRDLTRARSRRSALAAVVGGALSLLGLAETPAKKHKKHKKKHSPPASPPPGSPPSPPPPSPPPAPTCVPQCAGRQCDADGCGGSCGTCTAGAVCQARQCVNGSIGVNAPCDQALPRACASGVCGCFGANCTCRNPVCGAPQAPCGGEAECCTGTCAPFVDQCF